MIKTARKCPVCKMELCENCFSMEFGYNRYLPSKYNIVSCGNCGFCFSDSDASMEDYDNYYINCNSYSEEQKQQPWQDEMFKITRELILELALPDAKILDMGFGKGELLCWLKEEGEIKNLYGIDPSESSVRRLCEQGIPGMQGGVYDVAEAQYNVVMLFNVLEHLFEPGLAIQRLAARIKDDGILILGVPIYDRLENDNTSLANNFNREHINYFSEVSIRRLAQKFGLCEQTVKYIEMDLLGQGSNQLYLGVFKKKINQRENNDRTEKDTGTKKSIMEYYQRKKKLVQVTEKIENLLERKVPIAIWGAGEYLSNLMVTTELSKCNISFLIDNNSTKVGKKVDGYEVCLPDALYGYEGSIVICSMMGSEAIKTQIKKMGLPQEVIIMN